MKKIHKNLASTALSLVALSAASGAHALTATAVNGNADNGASLVAAVLGGSSGLTVTTTSFGGAAVQSGTYSGFNTVGLGALGDGIALSSGHVAEVPLSNTDSAWSHESIDEDAPEDLTGGLTDDTDLVALLLSNGNEQGVNDVNFLEFTFTVADLTKNSVSASFVFGTEEFPDQSVTDIFAFFVDGKNFAFFPDGSLINFDLTGPSAGFYQSNLENTFNLEWDGLTNILQITGLLDMSFAEHTIKIAIADTDDNIFDSAVYIASLSAGTTSGGGGIGIGVVPEPGTLALLGLGLAGLGLSRRRKA